jgi:hypothetical protein
MSRKVFMTPKILLRKGLLKLQPIIILSTIMAMSIERDKITGPTILMDMDKIPSSQVQTLMEWK